MSGNFLRRGGLWVLAQSALLCAVIAGGVLGRGQWQGLGFSICGVVLLLLAGICGVAGGISLGHRLTPFPKPTAHTALVTSGIYRLVRHPLYTAVLCGSLGWALLWRSWPALVATLAAALFLDAKARREERWLRQQFPEYSRYAQRVRRFVPGIY